MTLACVCVKYLYTLPMEACRQGVSTWKRHAIKGGVHDIAAGQPQGRCKLPGSNLFKAHLLRAFRAHLNQRLPCMQHVLSCKRAILYRNGTNNLPFSRLQHFCRCLHVFIASFRPNA